MWPVLVFGAPGALLGLAVCVAGLVRESRALLTIGGLLMIPSSYYLGGYPGLKALLALPICPWAAAWVLPRKGRLVAGLCLIPNLVAVVLMSAVTLRNLLRLSQV